MTTVLIAVPDLMISTRIADVAHQLGFTTADTPVAALPTKVDDDTALVVVDISQSADWESAIRTLKSDDATAGVPIIAFGPHVDVEASRGAVAAGTDRFLTRGKFMRELPDLLARTARR